MEAKITKKNILIGLVFAGTFLYLVAQFSHVMVYFDDYGYYSLTYGADLGHTGNAFSFGELLSFLKEHYYGANGRLLGYLVWLSLYCVGGLKLVQLGAATITTLVLFLLWKFIDDKENALGTAVLVCAFYGLFPVSLLNSGAYWFAAFFHYVMPVAGIILFLNVYFKHRQTGLSGKTLAVLVAATVLSAYSQEQLGATVTFMLCLIVLYELLEKNIKWQHFLFIAIALISTAVLMLGPATQSRANAHSYTLLQLVITSTYSTIWGFLAADMRIFVILLYAALLAFSSELWKRDRNFGRLLDGGAILLAVGSILVYCCPPLQNVFALYLQGRYYAMVAIGVPIVALLVFQIMRYYFQQQKIARLILFMAAVGSVGCLCFVLEHPERLFIPTWLMLFPTLVDGIFSIVQPCTEKESMSAKLCFPVVCGCLVIGALCNAGQIYAGYAENAEVYWYNDQQLLNAAEQGMENVYLKTYPDVDCVGVVPYGEGVQYMKYWICNYYDISPDVAFYYSASGSAEEYLELENYIFLENP